MVFFSPHPRGRGRSVEEDAGVDVQHLAGDTVRLAERDHLVGHVLHARRALQGRALPRPVRLLRAQPRGHPRAFHQARGDAVHRHVGGEGDGEAAREVDQARLAGGVGDAAPPGVEPGHRGDVDDAAGATLLEVRSSGAAHEVGAAQIGGEQSIPDLGIESLQIGEGNADVPRRIVDEDVETAVVLRHRLYRGGNGLGLGLVEGHAPRSATQRFHGGRGLARGVRALEIGDGDVGACSREGARDGHAEKSGAARHECDAILEVHDGGRVSRRPARVSGATPTSRIDLSRRLAHSLSGGHSASLPASAQSARLSTFAALKGRNYSLYWFGLVLYVLGTAFLLTVLGLARLEILLALAALSNVFRAFDEPSRMALVPQLVDRDRLPNAIALGSIPWQAGRMVGPSVTGILIAALGGAVGFGMAAVSSCLALLLYSRLRLKVPVRPADGRHVLQQFAEGLSFVGQNFVFAGLIALALFNSLFAMSYLTLLPIYADAYFGAGSTGFGLLNAAHGTGALVGTLTVATIAHLLRRGHALLTGAACVGMALMLFSRTHGLAVALPVLVIVGFCNTFYLMQVSTYLQQNVPDHLRGRVMSLYSLCWNLLPLGGLLAGALAAAVDARFAVLFGGFMVTANALVLMASRRLRSIT